MKIFQVLLLFIPVLTASNCLKLHTARTEYLLLDSNGRIQNVLVFLSDDNITFISCMENSAKASQSGENFAVVGSWTQKPVGSCTNGNDKQIQDLFSRVKSLVPNERKRLAM